MNTGHYSLSLAKGLLLFTINQNEDGVFFTRSNLFTGAEMSRTHIRSSVHCLIPPMVMEVIDRNEVVISYHVAAMDTKLISRCFITFNNDKCEVLRSIRETRFSGTSLDDNEVPFFVHSFDVIEVPMLIVTKERTINVYALDPEAIRLSPQRPWTLFTPISDADKFCAATADSTSLYLVRDRVSAKLSGAEQETNPFRYASVPTARRLDKIYLAMTETDLFCSGERINLPEGTCLGAGLVFDENGDLIVTDRNGKRPRAHRIEGNEVSTLARLSSRLVMDHFSYEAANKFAEVFSEEQLIRAIFTVNMKKEKKVLRFIDNMIGCHHPFCPTVFGYPKDQCLGFACILYMTDERFCKFHLAGTK